MEDSSKKIRSTVSNIEITESLKERLLGGEVEEKIGNPDKFRKLLF